MIETILLFSYFLTVAGLSVYGLLGLVTLILYWRHRQYVVTCPIVEPEQLPKMTIQLPIYNERFVVSRLVRAAAALDYPADRLQIQVIDDSTDDTTELAAHLVKAYQAKGVDIELLHRSHRLGYKAGALQKALASASGEYLVIFDADFEPKPDFLLCTIPYFLGDSRMGMIQARWGHLNAGDSALTAAQSIALDKHFQMEQTVRHRANLFPKFNGAAGIWRRRCLLDAGGWQSDTVCEDLCLSTRATLKGWRFLFLSGVVAPAELPVSLSAYKNQQARWAKGSMQCLQKYGGTIVKDGNHTWASRSYALLSMSAYVTHVLVIILLLLQLPLIWFDVRMPAVLVVFSLAGIGQPLLFVAAQKVTYDDWLRRLRFFPGLIIIAVGLAASNSRALIQALSGQHHPFIRTPKRGYMNEPDVTTPNPYDLPLDRIVFVEFALALYAAIGMVLALVRGNTGPALLLITCLLGFGLVAAGGLSEYLQQRAGELRSGSTKVNQLS